MGDIDSLPIKASTRRDGLDCRCNIDRLLRRRSGPAFRTIEDKIPERFRFGKKAVAARDFDGLVRRRKFNPFSQKQLCGAAGR